MRVIYALLKGFDRLRFDGCCSWHPVKCRTVQRGVCAAGLYTGSGWERQSSVHLSDEAYCVYKQQTAERSLLSTATTKTAKLIASGSCTGNTRQHTHHSLSAILLSIPSRLDFKRKVHFVTSYQQIQDVCDDDTTKEVDEEEGVPPHLQRLLHVPPVADPRVQGRSCFAVVLMHFSYAVAVFPCSSLFESDTRRRST